jgi:TM2 domain-containing membrane protein YozV
MAKNKWISFFFLCMFLGVLGIHKFYEGRILFGVLYLCAGGILGIGVVIDLIILLFKPNQYYP